MSTAMDGVLEGAVALCVCKLACSLLFLPSLTASYSSVSFCCCCLLIFTDFQVTVFLSLLCIFESWLTEVSPTGDVIALRFLLFLSHTYGAVLLLSTFLIAAENLIRLLWPHTVVSHRAVSQTGAQQCHVGEEKVEEEEDIDGLDNDMSLHQVGGFLCCLSVWIVVALNVRWRWKVEEKWAADCLYTTDSLVRCLPNLLASMPSAMNPFWSMAFLFLLLLLLTISPGLQRQHQTPAQAESTHGEKDGDYWWQDFISVLLAPFKPLHPGMSVVEPKLCVDPEKTDSSCTGNTACSWNSVQMSTCHHGDVISPDCFSGKRERQEHESSHRGISLTFITEKHVDSPHSQCEQQWWGFPSLEVNVMIGLVGVLSILMLPFNLSVNILLIRTIDVLLEWCITSLLSSTANTRDSSTSHSVAQV
ncbi:uncharacterized protein LOC121636530 [Melanotaenia boesemani]|uniref:uncharacterized protein LOC121636530 n=1 Tax=Melanotaenia boesemani TaxID=1250792 RepID=UPI001C04733C|nr:uncharacterized protein LOC121636530 [Melanotaenia boesemani]XP_041836007.1 uncharacterized protein LOC121636530 [Melanotaenia boesemani]XP_041836008.1 uncharacterized protein LOC121636530 [Melanotaenia boesemani]XP_041836009.1 uncharacterized protein LOC121636530 [Melanotaenia boesemani]XP_041836010.1 uncharacterized protein LOC121636530 [Melanotaenia boesemani]